MSNKYTDSICNHNFVRAPNHENNQGLGIDRPENVHTEDNEYDAYRKRMMLAYRFRPNPLVSTSSYN